MIRECKLYGRLRDVKRMNRARYYDPSTGRFLSEDPIGFNGGDFNLYRYVGNNPVLSGDPSGKNPGAIIIFGVAAVAAYTAVDWLVSDFAKEQEGVLYKGGLNAQDKLNQALEFIKIDYKIKVLDPEKDFKTQESQKKSSPKIACNK
jgi:RHS repeat-associated protein